MTADAYRQIIAAPLRDRLDLFLTAANRLGTPVGNIEKDFWVCWTLDVLYHRLPNDAPRLLFNGGTSLSKAYGLIQRFSEDIDVTVFRDDLDERVSIEELQVLWETAQSEARQDPGYLSHLHHWTASGQNGYRSRPAPLVRTARCIATGGTADLPSTTKISTVC